MNRPAARMIELARHDLAMAEFALQRGMHEQCMFHCQQALEKGLKALLMQQLQTGRPRRTHDLVSLAEDLRFDLSDAEWLLLRSLGDQYSTSRYGEDVDYEASDTADYLERTVAFFQWLLLQLN